MQSIIAKYGETNITVVYDLVRTFKDLIDTNVAFLQGKIKETPYQLAPPDKETTPLLGKLIRINLNGFFSTEGQPPNCEYGKFIDEQEWFHDWEQKSYITGVISKKNITSCTRVSSKPPNKQTSKYEIGNTLSRSSTEMS